MNASFEPALIGGPCSFAFSLPPIANAIKPKVVPRVAIESCNNGGCQETLATLVEDERKREFLGEKMEETHNMGADLTTEDCILGDHTRECQWAMRRYFELNVPINESKIRGLRSSVGSAARVKARAGLAGRAIAGSFRARGVLFSMSVYEHETQSYISRRVSVHSRGFRSLHLTLGSHVEQQGFQYYCSETRETLRS